MATDIKYEETDTKGRYVYQADGGPEAELTFSKASAEMIIVDHTGVPDEYRGQGVGLKLVEHAVSEARKNGWKILPLCPFTAAQFRKHPDLADVLKS